MFRKILKMILYFFIIFATPAYADNYENTGDGSDNRYYQTVAFTSYGYPSIKNILYERHDFMAEDTGIVFGNDVGSYTDFDFTRRVPNMADHVDAPPGTQVDIVYLYRNDTGHNVDISKIRMMFSRNNKDNGNLTDILNITDPSEGNIFYKYSNQNLVRSGVYKEYPGVGLVSNNTQGAYVLDSMVVKNPLLIEQVKLTENPIGDILAKIFVRNMSEEYFNNIKFTYGSFEKIFNMPAYQEEVITFTIPNTTNELGTFSIYNPNIKQICAVYGNGYYNYLGSDAVPVLAYRGADIVSGAMLQPIQEGFCVKRIPYTMISEPMMLSEENETGVLGISDTLKILPKTGKIDWLFVGLLVVDGLLWYSFGILRRKYESKNINTRVCTKSSKNVGQGGV